MVDSMRPVTELRLAGRVFTMTMAMGRRVVNTLELGVPGVYKGGDGVSNPAMLSWDGAGLVVETRQGTRGSIRTRYSVDANGCLVMDIVFYGPAGEERVRIRRFSQRTA
jgi:hypothetical protein